MKSLQIIFVLIFVIGLNANAQNTLSGKIIDETGQELPGANIVLDDGTGTVTDLFGNFKLNVESSKSLTLSYVGYEKQELSISSLSNPVKITMKPGSLQLSDVLVTTEVSKTLQNISNYDIKQRPIMTSQDVLRIIPGLFIAQHAGGGKAEQIFLRGFDIDHGTDIALSVDGMPVNMVSHAHGQGYSDLHFVIPETIEGVNFSKGLYNSQKGDFTTAGFADFSTRQSIDKSAIKLEGGLFGTLRTVALMDLSGEDKNAESAYVASEVFLSDGYFESPQNFSRINLMGKYSKLLNKNTRLTTSISTFTSKWDASGQIPQRAVNSGLISRFGSIDNTEGGETSRTNLNVVLKSSISDSEFLTNQIYFSDYDFKLFSNFTFFLNDSINGDQIRQSEHRKIYGYKGAYNKDWQAGSFDLTTSLGGGVRYDDINDISLSRTLNRETVTKELSRGNIDQFNFSAYLNQNAQIGQLSLDASLRIDYFSFVYANALSVQYDRKQVTASTWSPKFIANYKVNEQLSLFGKIGEGFHSNDARVVVAQQGNDILPKAYGADLGFVFKPFTNMAINTAFWILDLDQEFVYVGDEGIVEPSGKTRRKGLDVSIRYQITNWLYADIDVNTTDPKAVNAEEGNNFIPLAPTFTSIGGLSFDFKNGFKGSVRYRFLDDRPSNEDNSVKAVGYYLMDVTLKYTKSKFEVSLVAENLLNVDWNEAQFETESRLFNETEPVSEIHFTPGSPFFAKLGVTYFF